MLGPSCPECGSAAEITHYDHLTMIATFQCPQCNNQWGKDYNKKSYVGLCPHCKVNILETRPPLNTPCPICGAALMFSLKTGVKQ